MKNEIRIYTVASKTVPNRTHEVWNNHTLGRWKCTCQAFLYRRYCSHIREIKSNVLTRVADTKIYFQEGGEENAENTKKYYQRNS